MIIKKIILSLTVVLGIAGTAMAQSAIESVRYGGFCNSVNSVVVRGENSERVRELQFLIKQQYAFGQGITGFYGALTERNVRFMQRQLGINPSGAIGPFTLAKLRSLWCTRNIGSQNPINSTNPSTPIISINPISSNGNNVTIGWATSNASSCTINGENVGVSGTRNYTIYSEANYRIICISQNGLSAEKALSVKPNAVNNANAPSINLSINPTTFTIGQYANLNWTSSNANTCSLNNENVPLNSNRSIYISGGSQVYTLYCVGSGGNSTQAITINGSSIVNQNNNTINTFTGASDSSNNNNVVLNWTGSGTANACSLFRVTSLGPTDNIVNGPTSLIASNLSTNQNNYITPFVSTSGNYSRPTAAYKLVCGNDIKFVNVIGENIVTNLGSVTTSGIYQTGNQMGINWKIPSNYENEAQGVIVDLVDTNTNNVVGTIGRYNSNQSAINFRNGLVNWTIAKSLTDSRNDAISCKTINGETLCGNVIISGNYKVRTTYFTPSNACLGFCQLVSGQKTLGTVESNSFYINSTVNQNTANNNYNLSLNTVINSNNNFVRGSSITIQSTLKNNGSTNISFPSGSSSCPSDITVTINGNNFNSFIQNGLGACTTDFRTENLAPGQSITRTFTGNINSNESLGNKNMIARFRAQINNESNFTEVTNNTSFNVNN